MKSALIHQLNANVIDICNNQSFVLILNDEHGTVYSMMKNEFIDEIAVG